MTAILQIQNVSKQFDGLAALTDVSFEVQPGELLALVGPNGAGKSTLFNAIAGVFAPTKGQILLGGQDITGLPSHALARRGLARTFQMVPLPWPHNPNCCCSMSQRQACRMKSPVA